MQAVHTNSKERYRRLIHVLAGLMVALGLASGGLLATDSGRVSALWWDALLVVFVGLGVSLGIVCSKERQQRRVHDALEAHVDATLRDLRQRADAGAPSHSSRGREEQSLDRLREAYLRLLESVAHPLGGEDSYDSTHGEQVALLAQRIATQMKLSREIVDRLGRYGAFFDHGKFAIAAKILQKTSALEAWEWTIARKHVELGVALLEPLQPADEVIAMIRHHHERWDGKGYPDCLKGEEIPIEARILAVADAYHAIISPRPYAAARTAQQALAEIEAHAGAQFAPAVVEALKAVCERQLHPVAA